MRRAQSKSVTFVGRRATADITATATNLTCKSRGMEDSLFKIN